MRNNIKKILLDNAINEKEPKTQFQVALAVGMDPAYLSKIIAGQIEPGVDRAMAISRALDKPVEEVFIKDCLEYSEERQEETACRTVGVGVGQ